LLGYQPVAPDGCGAGEPGTLERMQIWFRKTS
jgi:hypothetical protein